jgi:DNA-binding winged helix-turn-helix (wHTH) protein
MLDPSRAPVAPSPPVVQTAVELIAADPTVDAECANLWASLTEVEQRGLIAIAAGLQPPPPAVLRRLTDKGLVRNADAECLLSSIFAHYVRGRVQRHGLEVDVESGDVRVNGQPPREALTLEETRALVLLWQRAGRTVSKAELSAAAWGHGYVPGTDDGRLHKFIERLRAKVEPDPDNPIYVTTERARGYRLVLPAAD